MYECVRMRGGCQHGEQQPDVTIHWILTRVSFTVLPLCESQRRLSGWGRRSLTRLSSLLVLLVSAA